MTTPESLRWYPCQELVELVTEYLEDALTPFERASFESHLAICTGCRAHVDQVRRTVDTLHKLAPEPLAPEARQNLLDIFHKWKGGAA